MNSIIWKGVPSTTIKGLLISELPPITVPAMRIKETTIDGRDGSIIEELGYSSYDKSVVIGLYGNFDINKVIKYFAGEGEVVFSNEPDKVYTAKIVGQIDYNRLLRYRQATIPFRVQPYKHKLYEAYKPAPTEEVSGASIVVPDIADAKLKTFSIYGKTTQNGTPTPASPVDLVSAGDSGSITVNATGKDDAQSMTIATPNGLHGIPVSSGGNYTDASGQQWICDEVDFARGMYVQRIKTVIFDGSTDEGWKYSTSYINAPNDDTLYARAWLSLATVGLAPFAAIMCDKLWWNGQHGVDYNPTRGEEIWTSKENLHVLPGKNYLASENSATTMREWLATNPVVVLCEMENPVETQLSAEELAAYSTLHTINPNTTIRNDANAHMKLEYFKPFEVFNEGLENSKPIMVLKGEGSVVISVNGLEIFEYTFPEGENEVVIDSEKEDAYLGDVLKNRNMNGEFPVLLPGTNIIEWSGYVSSIEILPRSRWL